MSGLRIKSAGDAIQPRWLARAMPVLSGPVDPPDKTTAEGLFDLPYEVANQQMEHVATRMGVPVGFWRSVGHSHNAFFSEGFMDELAAAAGKDPVEFRRKLLADAPRFKAVLKLAAEKSGWGGKLAAGRARGVALHEVVRLNRGAGGGGVASGREPRVHRVFARWIAARWSIPEHRGPADGGSAAFALSAALYGESKSRAQCARPTFPTTRW